MTPQEYEAKIKIYQDALAEVVQQLTHRRTELGSLARKTVEDVEASLPLLRKKEESLRQQIVTLDKIIEEKAVLANKAQEDFKAKYNVLASELDARYLKKEEDLSKKRVVELKEIETCKVVQADLAKREEGLVESLEALANGKTELAKNRKSFESTKNKELEEIAKLKEDAFNKLGLVEAEKRTYEAKVKEYDALLKYVSEKGKNVDTILARVYECDAILKTAKLVEANNKEKETRLNEMNARNIADARRNSARTELLDEKDNKILIRETNVKLIEAGVKLANT